MTHHPYRIADVIRTYRWKSVFFSYCRRLFLLILIIIVPYNIIVYRYYQNNTRASIINATQRTMSKSKDIFDLLMNEFDRSFLLMSSHAGTEVFLNALPEQLSQKQADTQRLQRDLQRIATDSEAIVNASIYSFTNDYLISGDRMLPADKAVALPEMEWFNAYRATKLSFLMIPRKVYQQETYDALFIIKVLKMEDHYLGLFCIQVQYPYFEEMIYTAISPPPDELYVLSDIGLVLYSTRREMINRPFFYYPQISRRYEQVHASEDHTLITRQSVHFETVSQDDHISLYSVLDANDFTLPYSRTMIFLTSMIVIVLSLAVSFLMSIKMYRNIVEMILLIQNPEECPRSTAGLGEFLYISESISSATKKSNAMRAKLQTSLDALKSSQSVALQAQINPHFLFNTLQMVNLAILKECKADNDAVRIVNLLSDLLRCAFDNSTVLVSVEEEMDYAEKYLQIQKIRYRDRLQIHIFVEEETYPYKTLKLMCQPLIENCILHGLLRQKGEWHIHLHAFIEGSMLCVEIRDNGVGMSEAALASLRTRIEQSTLNKAENIGLANVHARLRLIFAEHYSLSLESKEGVGTTICLRHPLL